jgi:hypothetical protein
MKGLATLDTGHNSGVGKGLSGTPSLTPIDVPRGWHITEGYTLPGIKATIPKLARRWLLNIRKNARTEALVEALEDDDTIDEILQMLDASTPIDPVSAYL